jgi:hypothetical protein
MVGGDQTMKRRKVLKKLKRTYIKMLYAFANGLIARGYELEDKAIRLELKLKESEDESKNTTHS